MNQTLYRIVHGARAMGLAALLIQLTACGPSLNYVYMSKDSEGSVKTTKFLTVGDEIHCVMEVVGGDEETTIRLDLYGPGAFSLSDNDFFPRPDPKKTEPVQLDIQIFQFDAMGNKLSTGPWPIGAYGMDVFVDNGLEESLAFDVVD